VVIGYAMIHRLLQRQMEDEMSKQQCARGLGAGSRSSICIARIPVGQLLSTFQIAVACRPWRGMRGIARRMESCMHLFKWRWAV